MADEQTILRPPVFVSTHLSPISVVSGGGRPKYLPVFAMKIFILGATGFLGRQLIPRLLHQHHTIMALVRNPEQAGFPPAVELVVGDGRIQGAWQQKVAQAEVVINLAGCSIATAWSKEIKEEIYESRIYSTRHVVEAMSAHSHSQRLLINASAVGYYGFQADEWCTENTPPGKDFLASVCKDWEQEALKSEAMNIAVVIGRMGVILGHGGALERMLKIFRRFLGSSLGTGKQWFSWIHIHDVLEFLCQCVEGKHRGIYNVCAPHPVRNLELTKLLAQALQIRIWLPNAPAMALKLALGEFASVILEGQRVKPQRLLDAHFEFRFPDLASALADLTKKQ